MFSSHKVGGSPRVLEKDSREASHRHSHHQQMVVKHYLKGETEGLLVTAQDQVINTRNYLEGNCGQQVESKCRMCLQNEETVDHIVSGCELLAKTE